MSNEFRREDRYIVFKLSDVERYLTDADRTYLAMMKNEIDAGRDCANKHPFKGLIVESDWPEYEPTWKAIEGRVIGAQPAPSIPEGWKLVPTAESRHPGIYKMLSALHAVDNTPGASEWASYAAFLAAAPEAKP